MVCGVPCGGVWDGVQRVVCVISFQPYLSPRMCTFTCGMYTCLLNVMYCLTLPASLQRFHDCHRLSIPPWQQWLSRRRGKLVIAVLPLVVFVLFVVVLLLVFLLFIVLLIVLRPSVLFSLRRTAGAIPLLHPKRALLRRAPTGRAKQRAWSDPGGAAGRQVFGRR